MAKKCKIHDPMKTISYQIYDGGVVRTKFEKINRTKRMFKLMSIADTEIRKMIDKANNANSSVEAQYIMDDFCPKIAPLLSEYAAILLVANHIAHRGKPLHADTAIKKLEQMQHEGLSPALGAITRMAECQRNGVDFGKNTPHDLRYFLRTKFGITLMDKPMYDYCLDKIKLYKQYPYPKALQKHTNFAKKFHVAVKNPPKQQMSCCCCIISERQK